MWQAGDLILYHYEVLRSMQGSMGIVYVVRDVEYDTQLAGRVPRLLAAKALRPHLAALPALRKRFLEEAKLWIGMRPHRHVVRAYFSDTFLDTPYIFADYVAPGLLPNSLAAWMARGLTPPPVALYLLMGIASGLEDAYTDGIVCHGDLKPANVLIDSTCDVQIADWGLSHAVQQELEAGGAVAVSSRPNADLLQADSLLGRGTPGYAAPELMRGEAGTKAADIFSLGAIAAEMLTGGVLAAGTGAEQIGALLAARFPWHDGERQEAARGVAELLEADPQVRTGRYGEALDRLGGVLAEITGLGTPGSQVMISVEPIPAAWRSQSAVSLLNLGETSRGYDRLTQLLHEISPESKNKPIAILNIDHGNVILPRQLIAHQEAEVAAQPGDFEKVLLLVSTYAMANDVAAARALYSRLQALPAPSREQIEKLLALPAKVFEPAERLQLAARLVALAPDTPATHMAQAGVYADLGRVDEALAAWRRAEPLGELAAADLVLAGHLLALKGETWESLRQTTRAVRRDRKNGLAWYNRGVALRKLGKLRASRRSFRAAIEHGGQVGAAHNHLGGLLLEAGDVAAAAVELQEASIHSPENPKIWFNLGQCMRTLGHLDDALRYYDVALSLDPNYELARRARDELREAS
jgi:serine/threonine protein kinase/Flp pilus assembly protein TadD